MWTIFIRALQLETFFLLMLGMGMALILELSEKIK